MNSQLYTAASGLLVQQRRLETVSNNLANISTTGFRPQRSFATTFRGVAGSVPGIPANDAVAVAGAYEVPGSGPLRPTGRPLDIALDETDLLVVETPAGPRYTRDGALDVSGSGELVDSRGYALLNPDGSPIGGLTPGATIGADGRIVDGEIELGRLQIVRDPSRVLRLEGDNLFSAAGRDTELEPVAVPLVRPGTLEGSATRVLEELVALIDAQRAFEGYQRLVTTTINEVNRKAVTDIAG